MAALQWRVSSLLLRPLALLRTLALGNSSLTEIFVHKFQFFPLHTLTYSYQLNLWSSPAGTKTTFCCPCFCADQATAGNGSPSSGRQQSSSRNQRPLNIGTAQLQLGKATDLKQTLLLSGTQDQHDDSSRESQPKLARTISKQQKPAAAQQWYCQISFPCPETHEIQNLYRLSIEQGFSPTCKA